MGKYKTYKRFTTKTIKMKKWYFGAIEKYNDQDFLLTGSELNFDDVIILVKNFWDYKITYCQADINNSMCTIIAWCGIVGNMFWYRFPKEELLELVELAKQDWFIDGKGWWIYKAVDLVRKYWNQKHPNKQVITYRIPNNSKEFWDLLKKGYMLQTGFRWDRAFSQDKRDDCIINEVEKVDNPTYWHSIYFVLDKWKVKLFTVDSYNCLKCNEYEVENFKKLLDNNVYFKNSYVFIPKKNIMTQLQKDIKDIELALKLEITNNRRNLENIKKWKYTTDIKAILYAIRSYKLAMEQLSSKKRNY